MLADIRIFRAAPSGQREHTRLEKSIDERAANQLAIDFTHAERMGVIVNVVCEAPIYKRPEDGTSSCSLMAQRRADTRAAPRFDEHKDSLACSADHRQLLNTVVVQALEGRQRPRPRGRG
jgi:hypothetical protein